MFDTGFINAMFGTGAALTSIKHKDNHEVWCDLPGVKKEDLEISFDDKILKITAKRNKPEGEVSPMSETLFGEIERSIQLPERFDRNKIDASFENGVLKITLPLKKESKPGIVKVK